MNEEVIELIKKFGVGTRHPRDDFFKEQNDVLKPLRTFGVIEVDNEDFYHEPITTFSCHIPGCTSSFDTVLDYDQHYNSCHRFSCIECQKSLPSAHLLDLHLMETHDAFFAAQAERKPMFQCFIEQCSERFKNGSERRDHCIKVHKFPSDFRFDDARKQKSHKNKARSATKSGSGVERMETDADGATGDSNSSHTSSEKGDGELSKGNKARTKPKPKEPTFSFHNSRGRKKQILNTFSKDLKNSLPE